MAPLAPAIRSRRKRRNCCEIFRFATMWVIHTLKEMTQRSRGAMRPRFALVTLDNRGCRECRVHAAPAVSCASCTKKCAHEHTGTDGTLRHSLRNGFTAYAVLSPATNSSCHRRQRIDGLPEPGRADIPPRTWRQQRASGPHGFAVRNSVVRLARRKPLTSLTSPCDHLAHRRSRVHHIPSRVS